MGAIGNAISSSYNNVMKAADNLNADKLANRLVEVGYNTGAGRIGGFIAAATGGAGSLGATAMLWQNMSPLDTIREMPGAIAAQDGLGHQFVEGLGLGLEAIAETAILAGTINFGVQSVDAAVDMVKATKHNSLKLKDA